MKRFIENRPSSDTARRPLPPLAGNLLFLGALFAMSLLVMAIEKPLFLLWYHAQAAEASAAELALVVWNGLKLDQTVAGYITALPLLVVLAALWIPGRWSRSVLKGYLLVIPLVIASRWLKGSLPETDPADAGSSQPDYISDGESRAILFLGCALLVAVPVFKSVTHLPPYMGMVTALGIMWVFTELMYRRKRNIEESIKCRVAKVLKHIDMSTILFFLGILMAVAALESAGILSGFATGLNEHLHNVYAINTLIGILSSVVDNVPLVAASMGMYPIPDAAAVAASADPTYAAMFVQDGVFWHLLAYCAGVGGSLLIIGSAAGVVAMGLENINFVWYFKKISLMAFVGYLAGIGVYMLEVFLFGI